MERRLEQPALAQVLVAVQDEQRVLPEDRLEPVVGLARAQVLLVAGEDAS